MSLVSAFLDSYIHTIGTAFNSCFYFVVPYLVLLHHPISNLSKCPTMSSTPSWLDQGADTTPAVQDESLDVPVASPAPTTESSFATADEKDLPTIILYMRLANMGAAVALVTISVSHSYYSVAMDVLVHVTFSSGRRSLLGISTCYVR